MCECGGGRRPRLVCLRHSADLRRTHRAVERLLVAAARRLERLLRTKLLGLKSLPMLAAQRLESARVLRLELLAKLGELARVRGLTLGRLGEGYGMGYGEDHDEGRGQSRADCIVAGAWRGRCTAS